MSELNELEIEAGVREFTQVMVERGIEAAKAMALASWEEGYEPPQGFGTSDEEVEAMEAEEENTHVCWHPYCEERP
jgi:hypothetical protein